MQKLLTSVDGCGNPSVRSPDGEPVCLIACAKGGGGSLSCGATPNAPGWTWSGQKSPSAAVLLVDPEVSGLRSTGSVARKNPGPGRQSRLVSWVLEVVHGPNLVET